MQFIFLSVSAEDKEKYVARKLAEIDKRGGGKGETQDQVAGALHPGARDTIRIVDRKDHPQVPEDLRTDIEARTRCARFEATRRIPLLDGERITDEWFSYLAEAHGDVPKGTAVMVRTTSLSRMAVLYEDVRIVDGKMVLDEAYHRPPAVPERTIEPREFGIDDIALKIATSLASAIASKIGQKIADKILSGIFPPDPPPSYFNEVYERLSELFNQAVDRGHIDMINGKVNGFQNWYQQTFIPQREAGSWDREKMLAELDGWQHEFQADVIGPLETRDFAKAGLPTYMLASSLILMISSIQAEIDKPDDLKKSTYSKSRALQAKSFSKHTAETFGEMMDSAKNSVHLEEVWSKKGTFCGQGQCRTIPAGIEGYNVKDRWDHDKVLEYYKIGKNGGRDEAEKKKDGIIGKRVDTLRKSVGGKEPSDPDSIFGNWRKIAGFEGG